MEQLHSAPGDDMKPGADVTSTGAVSGAGYSSPDQSATAVAARLRILEEEFKRLNQRPPQDTPEESDSRIPGRSRLSTMKREQTRVVLENQHGGRVEDLLVHTDSGLRLTAERVVAELPPRYMVE